ncbi:MAG: hypothetical protein U0235_19680 [Polyangiaceae bacterium]
MPRSRAGRHVAFGAAGVAAVALIDELVRLRDALVAEDAQREAASESSDGPRR